MKKEQPSRVEEKIMREQSALKFVAEKKDELINMVVQGTPILELGKNELRRIVYYEFRQKKY